MAAYLEILNDATNLVVDDEFSNLRFIRKYSVTINIPGPFGQNFRTGTLNISGVTNPVLAIKTGTVGVCFFKMVTESNGSLTYYFQAGDPNVDTVITVYLFDYTSIEGNFGLQTFDANGKLVFDSSSKYMRVRDVTTFTNYETAVLPTLPAGNYAYVVSGTFYEVDEYHDAYETGEPFAQVNVWRYMLKSTSTGAVGKVENIFNMRTGVGITSPFNYSVRAGSILFIDVTGL